MDFDPVGGFLRAKSNVSCAPDSPRPARPSADEAGGRDGALKQPPLHDSEYAAGARNGALKQPPLHDSEYAAGGRDGAL